MAEQKDKKNWGVAEFESYHAGKMPVEEMHALEKAALDDPFLEDALEGYQYTATPVEDIEALQLQLQHKEKENKIVWFKRPLSMQLFRVAAAIIILFGFSWIIYQNHEEKAVEIASVKPITTIREMTQDISKDSAEFITAPIPAAVEAGQPVPSVNNKTNNSLILPGETKSSPAKTSDREIIIVQSKIADEKASYARKENQDNPFAKMPDVKDNADKVFEGRVVDNNGKPVPFAAIIDPNNNQNIFANSDGYFSLKNNQNISNVEIKVNAAGYETSNAALTLNNNDNRIVLQNNNKNALAEVVVTGYGSQKRKNVTSSIQEVKSIGLASLKNTVFLKNAIPVNGSTPFNVTIKELFNNQPKPDTAGQVILLFDINAFHKVINISVKKSLSDSTNNIAIRILQQAPPLKNTKKSAKPEAVFSF